MNLLLWHLHLYKCGFHIPEQNIPLSNIIDCLDESARWSFSLHCFPRCIVLRIAITCMLLEQNETPFILTHTHTHTHTNRRNYVQIFYYFNVYPTRLNVTQFIWKLLYMFWVVPPSIIRSAYNCIYSIWYLSHCYYYLPL